MLYQTCIYRQDDGESLQDIVIIRMLPYPLEYKNMTIDIKQIKDYLSSDLATKTAPISGNCLDLKQWINIYNLIKTPEVPYGVPDKEPGHDMQYWLTRWITWVISDSFFDFSVDTLLLLTSEVVRLQVIPNTFCFYSIEICKDDTHMFSISAGVHTLNVLSTEAVTTLLENSSHTAFYIWLLEQMYHYYRDAFTYSNRHHPTV